MGGSILAQCFEGFGGDAPDLDDAQRLRAPSSNSSAPRAPPPAAALPRPFRRRRLRRAVRNGLRLALRPGHRARRLGRGSRRRRVPHPVQRGARRGGAGRGRGSRRIRRSGRAATAWWNARSASRRSTTAAGDPRARRRQRLAEWRWDELVRRLVVGDARDAAPARQPESADAERDAVRRSMRPGCSRSWRSMRGKTSPRRSSPPARGRGSRSCASRA